MFVQQLGYRLADGVAPSPRAAVVALGGIVALVAIGASPANLFEALNPAHRGACAARPRKCALFAAVRPTLARWGFSCPRCSAPRTH